MSSLENAFPSDMNAPFTFGSPGLGSLAADFCRQLRFRTRLEAINGPYSESLILKYLVEIPPQSRP